MLQIWDRNLLKRGQFTENKKFQAGEKKIRAVVDFLLFLFSLRVGVDVGRKLAELEWKTAGHRTGAASEVEGRVAAVHAAAAEEGAENLEKQSFKI